MGAVDREEAAAVGAELLGGDDRGNRAAGDGLREDRLTVGSRAHRSGFERRDLRSTLEGHRHAAGDQEHADDEAQRHEEVGHSAPHVQVEVAHVLVAAQAADDRQQGGEPDHRREDLLPAHEEQLAEVREVDLARRSAAGWCWS